MRLYHRLLLNLVAVVVLSGATRGADEEDFYPALTPDLVTQLRGQITRMKADQRGPYLRIRWFCKDGTVHPPQGTPCRERGGGFQHAEFNDTARRMMGLGFHPGPILQALEFGQFADPATDFLLLKELVIQHYLFGIDDGWVLRRARTYRGARQIEDEERQGERYLEQLFGDPAWLAQHYLLAVQLAYTVPQTVQAASGTSRIRLLIAQAADLDSRLQQLRIKIHSFPSAADEDSVAGWLARPDLRGEVREVMAELKTLLEVRYRRGGLESVLGPFLSGPGRRGRECGGGDGIVGSLRRALETVDEDVRVSELARLSGELRDRASACEDGGFNLWLLNLNTAVQEAAFRELTIEPAGPRTRKIRLQELDSLFRLAYGAGFLSERELDALSEELARVGDAPRLHDYKVALNYLTRSLEWSEGTARQIFGPVFRRYLRVEPKTSGFFDDLVRSSNLFHLADRLGVLQRDAHDLMWGSAGAGSGDSVRLRGLNAGIAVGRFHVLEQIPEGWDPDSRGIYVIPESVAELRPVAGLVTMDAGNLLSHIQLLARSLQIPNASVSTDQLPALRRWEGQEVLFAVSPLGRVLLKPRSELTGSERDLVGETPAALPRRLALDLSRVRLDRAVPIPLDQIRAADSGVVVGPKAANLGELAHMFPERVAKGLTLPFGMFFRHVQQPFRGGMSTWDEIQATSEQLRGSLAAGRPESEVHTGLFPRLAYFREAIQSLPLVPEDRQAIERAVRDVFGDGLVRGAFVRSDTNVEDLPEFSGAGLNLTVPNQRTLPDILNSVKRLWASPFADRAYLWRSRVLEDLGVVLPSVLIQESVPVDRSGVLITANLEDLGREGMTVAIAEGVGGAVQGEAAETLILTGEGEVRLLGQAKAPFRRVLNPDGGVRLLPTSKGRRLLSSGDIRQLLEVAEKIRREMPGAGPEGIWDIEFGFTGDRLWLFQARPFVTGRPGSAGRVPALLDRGSESRDKVSVDLSVAP